MVSVVEPSVPASACICFLLASSIPGIAARVRTNRVSNAAAVKRDRPRVSFSVLTESLALPGLFLPPCYAVYCE